VAPEAILDETTAAFGDTPALELRGVQRTYVQAGDRLPVLRGVDLVLAPGEIVGLVGPSGAGKSTLLQIAGLLDRPDAGEVYLAGQLCSRLGDDARSAMRRTHLGFVFQFHHLLPEFSALENIVLPQLIAGLDSKEAESRAADLLDMMGLASRVAHRPSQLSGGEQQRVAIARAMANAPRVLLADEPTGNLDNHTAERVMTQLIRIVHRTGVAALVATHNLHLAAEMDRRVRVEEGMLVPA
jgi:lipoprotein-releasing system ATP-binding protein